MEFPQSPRLRVLAPLLVGALDLGLLPGHAAPLAPDDLDEEDRAERRALALDLEKVERSRANEEDRAERRALALRAVQEICRICHSEERQPPGAASP